jgi:acetyl esterase/lipase
LCIAVTPGYPLGDNWAYITSDPKDGKKHPAVVYAAGGFDFSIDAGSFEQGSDDNDQSGARLRTGGIVVMYPSYRGAHDNAGTFEMLYGEVDDYLAALAHVQALTYLDPARIYLVGHSTGGTLVALAAAANLGHLAEITTAARAAGAPAAGFGIARKGHFDVIAPTLESFAKKIADDTGSGPFAWEPPGVD